MFYDFLHSTFGLLYIEASIKGIKAIRLIDEGDLHTPRPNKLTDKAKKELKEYFAGTRTEFKVPLDMSDGTAFQHQVWDELLAIPYGYTITYLDIAKKLNNPKAVRAVGLANGQNPIPIIVPCHRVIGSNGSLVGYALGLDMKEKLLCLENPKSFGRQQELF
jgi:O-6-methylguanine DNA methyltransferase